MLGEHLRVQLSAANETDHGQVLFCLRGDLLGLHDGLGQLGRRVGMRPPANHDIQQDHPHRRVGRFFQQALDARGLVDHRVRSAHGEFVVAQVERGVAKTGFARIGQSAVSAVFVFDRHVRPDFQPRFGPQNLRLGGIGAA